MNPTNAKLLIVDQSASVRGLLREVLAKLNIVNIDEASSGRAALSLLESQRYDLVLSEWTTPSLSGMELLRRVRHAPVGSDTPVVLWGEDLSPKHTVEALQAGANGVLEKPFDVAKLCEKVQRIISSRSPRPEQQDAARAKSASARNSDASWFASL